MPNAPSDVETERLANSDANPQPSAAVAERKPMTAAAEVGGPSGPEPTRFGDWERHGRCIDF